MNFVAPFDGMAADYDRAFTASAVGKLMRSAVQRRLDVAFKPGERVLELNCGTGEDAIYLARRGVRVLATDSSLAMLAVARAKVTRAGLGEWVEFACLPIEELALARAGTFDGVFSNFGGLNCVDDLHGVARGMAAMVRPRGRVLLCVMGPAVPWEWAWYLARGKPAKALRRLRRGGVAWRGVTIRYRSIGALRRAFAPFFAQRRVCAVGALLPPSYAEGWAARHPQLLATLDRWERRAETIPPLPWLADHYLIELERVA